MSASCSIYNSSGSTKATHTIFLFFGNFQNWVYQNGTFFFPHLIGNWEDQALDVLLSFCAKLPKRLIVWETKLYFMTLYTVLRCPLHFRPIKSLRMHSGKITWYLLFPTYVHCFSVNNKPSWRTSIGKHTMADFFYETLQKKDSERCMFIVQLLLWPHLKWLQMI